VRPLVSRARAHESATLSALAASERTALKRLLEKIAGR
jgi:hypothetical protein